MWAKTRTLPPFDRYICVIKAFYRDTKGYTLKIFYN